MTKSIASRPNSKRWDCSDLCMWLTKGKELLLGALLGFWAVLTPIHTICYVIGALVLTDFVAGLYKSWRNKVPITSRRMRDTVMKTLAYQTAVMVGFAMDFLAGTEGLLCTRAIAVLIGLTEVKSLDESMKETLGFSIWEALMAKLKPAPKE